MDSIHKGESSSMGIEHCNLFSVYRVGKFNFSYSSVITTIVTGSISVALLEST